MAVKWKLTHTAHTHTQQLKDRRLMLIKSDLCMQYTHKYLSNRKTQKTRTENREIVNDIFLSRFRYGSRSWHRRHDGHIKMRLNKTQSDDVITH